MISLDVLTLLPEPVRAVLNSSILKRAQALGKVELSATDLRSFAGDKYRSVDDTPFGGQQGMLFLPEVVEAAMKDQLSRVGGERDSLMIVYTSPRGVRLDQGVLEALAYWLGSGRERPRRLAVLCGRFEGVDERIVDRWVDLEVSLGDFILTGGEIPALALADGLVRLLPGVLGDDRSALEDSFSNGLLEHPQYTKPRVFEGLEVPAALLTGHHAQMQEWKLRQSLLLTSAFRPDLLRAHNGVGLPQWARDLLEHLKHRLDLRA
jgi:tRNA (guanine37-N1)-methyltransferase